MHMPETEGPRYCSQYKIQEVFLVHAFVYKEYTCSSFYDLLPIIVSMWRDIIEHKTTSQPAWSQNAYIALYFLASLFAKDKDFPTDIELHITKV